MGGMFTYHAMNKIPDLIAAFCPVSGYPMGGATANANVRPLPILHIHGTGDGTCNFSGVQPALNVWINHNGCPTTAKVTNSYNGFGGAKLHIWGPGNDNVEVRLLELADKGHWICKEKQVYTGKEIWNFCKNYTLNKTSPNVSITAPKAGARLISYAPAGQSQFPDITITATADDSNGTVEKVEFYDGTTLLATCTAKPYEATLTGAKAGKHTIKAVATDNDGETTTASVEVTLQAPATSLSLSSAFVEGGALPAGWTTYDSNERRTGYSNGYSQGCRVLQFTGSPRGFNYGLYFRNISGSAHQGWAKYGLSDAGTTLLLAPGHYLLRYKICNWNMSGFGAVELHIENSTGSSIASQTYQPNINIGNKAANSFDTPEQQVFEFDVTEQGAYTIAIYSAASEWSDCIVGQLSLAIDSYSDTAIRTVTTHHQSPSTQSYDLLGRKISPSSSAHKKGLYIKNGKKYF